MIRPTLLALVWAAGCSSSFEVAPPLPPGTSTSVFVTGGAVDADESWVVRANPPDWVEVWWQGDWPEDAELRMELALPIGSDPGQVRWSVGIARWSCCAAPARSSR